MMHIIPREKDDGVKLDLPEGKLDEKMLNLVFVKLAQAVGKQFGFEPKLPRSAGLEKPDGKIPEKKEVKKQKVEPIATSMTIPPPKKEQAGKKAALDDIADFLTGGKQ